MRYKNFQKAYYGMLNKVLKDGKDVTVRGFDMKEIIPGYFEIKNPRDRLLNIDSRNIKRYIFGELLWYLSGRDDVAFISKYSKMWAQLTDDGIHNNSAYGKYIFRKQENGQSQWDFVKDVLKNDPYSRQAVIHIKPIQMYKTKDTVCTYFLQFFIRNNKLDMIASMRSNDLLFGTTYDVFMFTFMQELMAAELGIEVGTYKHFASNIHIYKKDMEKINKILEDSPNKKTFKFEKIQSDFREKDLPLLLKLEEDYWNNEYNIKYEKDLSPIGKQLIKFLRGE